MKAQRALLPVRTSASLLREVLGAFLLLVLLISVVGIPSRESVIASPTFVYPLVGTRVSSSFGTRTHPVLRYVKHHNGIDLAAPEAAPFRSIAAGTVVWADDYAGYGNLVVVQHANGLTSHYGHCSTIKVKTGKKVTAGQILGTVGSTGMVTGPHLHFEIRKDGVPQDPEDYIPGLAIEGEG